MSDPQLIPGKIEISQASVEFDPDRIENTLTVCAKFPFWDVKIRVYPVFSPVNIPSKEEKR